MSYYRVDFIGSYFIDGNLAKYIYICRLLRCALRSKLNYTTIKGPLRICKTTFMSKVNAVAILCRIFAYLLHEYEVTIEDAKH